MENAPISKLQPSNSAKKSCSIQLVNNRNSGSTVTAKDDIADLIEEQFADKIFYQKKRVGMIQYMYLHLCPVVGHQQTPFLRNVHRSASEQHEN